MSCTAVLVFFALNRIDAGYGLFYDKKWGISLPNKISWIIMEAPVFFSMLLLWYFSEKASNPVLIVFLVFFELHYFQRSFIFPFLIRGKNRMPLSIVLMGIVFNILNALMQGGWIFHIAPSEYYSEAWFKTPQFIIGTIVFFSGMTINLHSDHIVRNLRKPGDNNHYLPKGGMFRYVTSANYFGEFVEWTGFALLTWSWAGAVFALWTFANLCPRAARTYEKYRTLFGEELNTRKVKRIIPFIY